MKAIDINCDVGEGVGNEKGLFPLISRCNIACGAHAGDIETMHNTIRLAKTHTLKIGAHPSYPDRENFGRKTMDITEKALTQSLIHQLETFFEIADKEGATVDHIKAHGALYNDSFDSEKVTFAIIAAVKHCNKSIKLMAPEPSLLIKMAHKEKMDVLYEGFADRNYEQNLRLVSRSHPNAVITSPDEVMDHLLYLVKGKVKTIDKNFAPIKASSFCIHGDQENALGILEFLNKHLVKKGYTILR